MNQQTNDQAINALGNFLNRAQCGNLTMPEVVQAQQGFQQLAQAANRPAPEAVPDKLVEKGVITQEERDGIDLSDLTG